MKKFLREHVVLHSSLTLGLLAVTLALSTILVGVRLKQEEKLMRHDTVAEVLGPKNDISDRSKLQISTILSETPHVVGGWMAKIHFEKMENPVVYYWARDPVVDILMDNFDSLQKSGKGWSSAELNKMSKQSARNTEATKTGIINCMSITQTNLPRLAPAIVNVAQTTCRAPIPPFDTNVNMSLVVALDVPADENSPEIQAVRRALLQLQIDIFNRDYQGRETWARN